MMGQTIFLPDWLGAGTCDSYIRLDRSGNGYAFVFNANNTPCSWSCRWMNVVD